MDQTQTRPGNVTNALLAAIVLLLGAIAIRLYWPAAEPTAKPAPTGWQYTDINQSDMMIVSPESHAEFSIRTEKRLAELGNNGWEAYAVQHHPGTEYAKTWYLKRRK